MRGALLLGDNLETRGLMDSSKCTFCSLRETANHLFLTCNYAKTIWSLAPIAHRASLTNATSFTTELQASKKLSNLPTTGVTNGSLRFTETETLSKAIADAREWTEAQTGSTNQMTVPIPRLLRQDQHQLHQGSKTEEWVSSPLVAEGLAVREALYQAREHGFNSLILKLDAQILIRAINGRDSIKGLFEILQDVQSLTCYLSDFSFSHVPRSNNTAADLLANRALSDLYSA
ncbi:hypothetical protein IGI04_036729 [Brassica rapa subsp. trilocularis]|uniref:RNase H type-1 domain-containing protein n=1 Tax=Brassica rapa subsp. trilocularis TaxID=1813537 RepID=A0ABQ7LIA7_BRACM|nr:hypothetical protein IGI04_036729 [Brassica rapa subsp. trilocularis]